VGFPVLLLVLFTYAGKTDIENLSTAVLDFDRTPASRELVNRFINTKYFKLEAEVKSYEELRELIDKGKCFMGLVIPAGFSEDLHRRKGSPAKVLLVIDGSIPPTSIQAGNYGKLISAQFFADMTGVKMDETDTPQKLNLTPIKLQARLLYNPNLDAILFIIPGLIGYLLTFLTVMQSAMAVIREREAGTFDHCW
jgi:ABC-2 type transport system permease protein